jgi:hypothetical protein
MRKNKSRNSFKLQAVNRFVLLLLPLLIGAVLARAEVLPLKTYTSTDGLLYESVRRIYQDSRGLIWFCAPIRRFAV